MRKKSHQRGKEPHQTSQESREEGKKSVGQATPLLQQAVFIGLPLVFITLFMMLRQSDTIRDPVSKPLFIADGNIHTATNDTLITAQNNITSDIHTATNDAVLALIPYKRPVYQEYIIASTQFLLLTCGNITDMPMQLVASIQPGIIKMSNNIVVQIQEFGDSLAKVKLEDVTNKSYSAIKVFVSVWMLLINTIISYFTTIGLAILGNSIVLGFILSAVGAAIIVLVVTKTALGDYHVNEDNNSFAPEIPKLNESPKIKKTIRYNADSESPAKGGGEKAHKMDPVITVSSNTNIKVSPRHAGVVDNILVDRISGSPNRDGISSEHDSESNEIKVAKVVPIVPFAIDFPGHRTVPIEIQMNYNASKRTPEKTTHLDVDIDNYKHSISPTKVSPKNKTALEVNTYRLMSSAGSDRVIHNGEIDREEALKGLLLKTVESRLTPNKAPSVTSTISTSRATYIHDTSRSTIPQTHVIPTSMISPVKPAFTPPKTVLTPPRKMKSSTGTQTDKSTLRDGIANSRSSRTPTTSIGDEYHSTSRKIVNVPIILPSSLSKRGAVMAPKGTPPRETSKSSFNSVGGGSSDGSRKKTPSKSSFSSTGSSEDRGSSYVGIGPPPLTSLLTETYDSAINMNVTPSSNSKRLGSR